jgi:hypothetical protein
LCAKMLAYYGCCSKFVWPNGEPEDWKVTWEPAPCRAAEDFTS